MRPSFESPEVDDLDPGSQRAIISGSLEGVLEESWRGVVLILVSAVQ